MYSDRGGAKNTEGDKQGELPLFLTQAVGAKGGHCLFPLGRLRLIGLKEETTCV